MRAALVLLSGGLDSSVAFHWALTQFQIVNTITFDYGQIAAQAETEAAHKVWLNAYTMQPTKIVFNESHHKLITLPKSMFASASSILGRAPVDQYETVEAALANTPNDASYVPMRNAIFSTIAAHHLLAEYPEGGSIVLGIRARPEKGSVAFPDQSHDFAMIMQDALSTAAGKKVYVIDPLNLFAPTREATIRLADALPCGIAMLRFTVSCFYGTNPPCGKCIPCLRRAQAFAQCGMTDPAL